MNLMQLIKLVLDDAYAAIDAPDEATKDAQIKKALSDLSSEYGKLASKASTAIDYSDSVKRFAYIFKYTVAHADYIMQLIQGSRELQNLFSKDVVEVACLGGGPGSDLLGVLKYLIKTKAKNLTLKCYIFDKERAWGDSWSDVASQLQPPFQVFPVFQQMDVTDDKTWSSYQKFLRADLFTLSYFVSEVWKIKDAAEPFFEHCLSQMKSGSLLLFVDNNDSRFRDWFDAMSKKHGLLVVKSGEEELCFSNNEEKKDLGKYFDKFGWPKRKSDAAWRIMKKP
jgi:SAM-dependent methyltransferase